MIIMSLGLLSFRTIFRQIELQECQNFNQMYFFYMIIVVIFCAKKQINGNHVSHLTGHHCTRAVNRSRVAFMVQTYAIRRRSDSRSLTQSHATCRRVTMTIVMKLITCSKYFRNPCASLPRTAVCGTTSMFLFDPKVLYFNVGGGCCYD